MTRIGLLSDTHGYLDPALKMHFELCDEIWHAGDIGSLDVLQEITSWNKPSRVVYGNIDSQDIRYETAEGIGWMCENVSVYMTHIAGYPGKYNTRVLEIIKQNKPALVICGHSHILKIIYDKSLQHLHINPGACGLHGLHQVRTAVRFAIDGEDIKDMQVIELGKRGAGR